MIGWMIYETASIVKGIKSGKTRVSNSPIARDQCIPIEPIEI